MIHNSSNHWKSSPAVLIVPYMLSHPHKLEEWEGGREFIYRAYILLFSIEPL